MTPPNGPKRENGGLDDGAGAVDLVLLPGLDGTGDLFAEFVSALGGRLRTVVVRYPADATLGYDELTALARDALPRGRRFVVVAESFSGPIGLRLAAESPTGLLGLVLVASFAANPRPCCAPLRPCVGNLPFADAFVPTLARVLLGSARSPERVAALRIVEFDCAHLLLQSVPREAASTVEEFVASLGGGDARTLRPDRDGG